jgi:hypothetical protein
LGEEPEQNPNPRFLVKVENRPTLVWHWFGTPPLWYIIQQSKGDRMGVVENPFLDCVGGGQRRVAEFAVHYGLEWPGRLCTTNYYYYYYLP